MAKKIKTQSMPSVQTRDELVSNVGKLSALSREIVRLNAELNDKITPIKEEYDKKISALNEEIKAITRSCQPFCEANRAILTNNNRVKSVDLSVGAVKWRINPPSVSISQKNLAEVVDRLLLNPKYKRFVRQKNEVNRELILQYSEMFEDGQIEGIKIKKGEEQFMIEPYFDEVGGVK